MYSISTSAIIYDNVIIENGVTIEGFCQIGYGNNDKVIIKRGSHIRSGVIIYGGCVIGENTTIGHNTILRDKTIIGNNTIIGGLVMCEGDTKIGNNVLINAQSHITRFATIEDYVFFGANVIMANDNKITYKRKDHGKNLNGAVIKTKARLANGVKLLPNVILGEGCFIGVGSVVTRNVDPYTLVIGSPAKFVKNISKDDIVE